MVGITYTIDLIIAILFFLPFYMKLKDFDNFTLEISSYKLVSGKLLYASSFFVLLIELFLAISFGLGILSYWKETVAIILLLFFAYATYNKNNHNSLSSCRCFGNVDILNRYPVLRNIFLSLLIIAKGFFPHRDLGIISEIEILILSLILVQLIIILNNYAIIKSYEERDKL